MDSFTQYLHNYPRILVGAGEDGPLGARKGLSGAVLPFRRGLGFPAVQLVLADNHKQHPALGLRIPPYGLECSHSPVHFPGNVIGNLFVL